MTDLQHRGRALENGSPLALFFPPLAPRIAALAERNQNWGQESRYDFWRRKLLGKGESQTTDSLVDEIPEAVRSVVRDQTPLVETSAPVAATSPLPHEPEVKSEELTVETMQADLPGETPLAVAPAPLEVSVPVTVSETPSKIPKPDVEVVEQPKESGFAKIKRALSRTGQGLERVFLGQKQIDDDLLEDLETHLLTADLGMEVTTELIDSLTDSVKRNELKDVDRLHAVLKDLLVAILKPCEKPLEVTVEKPFVILTVGVNGVGKTTTIGKLAKQNLSEGRSVMLAAGDTFRAAAVEQLQTWGERNNVPVVAQHTGADSASVIYDALESARAKKQDVLIADTAGRLHNKDNLMEELRKIKRVMAKIDPSAPHEVLLVLDAGTGQNAVNQLEQFHAAVGVTGIILTKLDGTAKGGVIFALCRKFGIPVRYIGVGESVDDLQPFCASDFVDALLASGDSEQSLTVH